MTPEQLITIRELVGDDPLAFGCLSFSDSRALLAHIYAQAARIAEFEAREADTIHENVLTVARAFSTTWRNKRQDYWLSRLMEEVGELSGALNGRHGDTPELELLEIAGIAINWLCYRNDLDPSSFPILQMEVQRLLKRREAQP